MSECKNECYSVSLQMLSFVHADIPLLLPWTALPASLFSHFHRWDFYPTASFYHLPFATESLYLLYIFNPAPPTPYFLSLTETWISVMMEFSYQLSPTEATLFVHGLRRGNTLPECCQLHTTVPLPSFLKSTIHLCQPLSTLSTSISHLRANLPLPWWLRTCFRECQHPLYFWYSH